MMVDNSTAQHFPILLWLTGAPMTIVAQYFIVPHVNVIVNCAINRTEQENFSYIFQHK